MVYPNTNIFGSSGPAQRLCYIFSSISIHLLFIPKLANCQGKRKVESVTFLWKLCFLVIDKEEELLFIQVSNYWRCQLLQLWLDSIEISFLSTLRQRPATFPSFWTVNITDKSLPVFWFTMYMWRDGFHTFGRRFFPPLSPNCLA